MEPAPSYSWALFMPNQIVRHLTIRTLTIKLLTVWKLTMLTTHQRSYKIYVKYILDIL